MISIPALWLPILVAAVAVFVLSSILHMVLRYHASDYRPLPEESATLDKLAPLDLQPGLYHFPYCAQPNEMGTPEMLEKFQRGPVGLMTIFPKGPPAMGKYLGLWFAYTVVVGIFVAYIAGRTLAGGADFMAVFRFTGTVAFMSYGVANLVHSIWKGQPWSMTVKETIDGLFYALATGAVFGWLWPH